MLARLNKKMKDAATKVAVPISNTGSDNAFHVNSCRKYHAMVAMTTALPNLQQIEIGNLNEPGYYPTYKYNDGEDPDGDIAVYTANLEPLDIGILSNFTRLRELKIYDESALNGRYPMLFNFPLLQKLHIGTDFSSSFHDAMLYLKWDLEMLVGLPSLEELISESVFVTGNIRSLGILKDTLSKVVIRFGSRVQGNLMDLADFPTLK